MALAITSGYTVSAGEVWTPTKHNLSTLPSIQQGTGTITGRNTAGTGSIEELTAAQVRAILGLATTDSPTFAGLVISTNAPSGSGITALFAVPPAMGGTTPAAGNFTTLGATGATTFGPGLSQITGPAGNGVPALTVRPDNAVGIYFVVQRSGDGTGSVSIGTSTNHNLDFIVNNTQYGRWTTAGLSVTGTITSSGQMNAPVFNVTSARRFKKNIRTLAGIADLLRLRPVWYDDKKGLGRKRLVGFIAEEVRKVLPSMVATDAKGRVTGLNYSQLVALAVAGLQNHEKRLAKLERKAA